MITLIMIIMVCFGGVIGGFGHFLANTYIPLEFHFLIGLTTGMVWCMCIFIIVNILTK